jgi:hypothetical protein
MSGLKASEVKVMKKVTQILGERDESVRQAFGQFDQKVGHSFGMMEMKNAVLVKVVMELGMTEERLQEIFMEVQQEAKQAQEQPAPNGGENNEQQPYGDDPTGPSGESPEEQEADAGNELGSEHFGGD